MDDAPAQWDPDQVGSLVAVTVHTEALNTGDHLFIGQWQGNQVIGAVSAVWVRERRAAAATTGDIRRASSWATSQPWIPTTVTPTDGPELVDGLEPFYRVDERPMFVIADADVFPLTDGLPVSRAQRDLIAAWYQTGQVMVNADRFITEVDQMRREMAAISEATAERIRNEASPMIESRKTILTARDSMRRTPPNEPTE